VAYVIVLIVLAIAVWAISGPLRAERRSAGSELTAGRIAELEAAREAKYREIRDAELDVRTGKLSQEDYRAIDTSLRAEAIEILHALDRAGARPEDEADGLAVLEQD
jgi:type II secretory pathway component PulM